MKRVLVHFRVKNVGQVKIESEQLVDRIPLAGQLMKVTGFGHRLCVSCVRPNPRPGYAAELLCMVEQRDFDHALTVLDWSKVEPA